MGSSPSPLRRCAAGAVALGAAAVLGAQTPQPYPHVLDQVRGAQTRLATFPIRPMVESPDGSALWVVNHENNTLDRFVYPASTPTSFPVPWGPVSVAYWGGTQAGTNDDELLVACRATWAIAVSSTQSLISFIRPERSATARN